ncbi:MAG: bifunctional transaldolase/phosoglucose isomerase, partial [Acidimicrobiales bacterium]
TVASTDLDDAFFVVSSKSGTTLEVEVLLARAWAAHPSGSRYAAITDPDTPLAALAEARSFERVFVNPPDIGGRYSVLSYFGMVPAALAGVEVDGLCEMALETDFEAAVELGSGMGEAARRGQDKITIKLPPTFSSFGLWVEQLIAESTGKSGVGCVPVPTTEDETGDDRHHAEVGATRLIDLGGLFYRWEVATAVAGHVLGIDPFDEPNVAESKAATREVLGSLPLPEPDYAAASDVSGWLDEVLETGDYIAVQAYLPYGHPQELEKVRRRLRDDRGGMAVTAGYGPRFLHSTGQLHKGGPNEVVALQLVRAGDQPAVAIPDHPYDFGTLITAQALGDYGSLRHHDRRVLRVAVEDLGELA